MAADVPAVTLRRLGISSDDIEMINKSLFSMAGI